MDRCSLTFVLLAAAVCISAGSLTAGGSSPSDQFVRDACMTTQYPGLCQQCLASYAPTIRRSKRQLVRAALAVSADRAQSASTLVRQMSAGRKKSLGSTREAGAIGDCLEAMRDGLDRLRRSVREIERMGRARSPQFAWHLSNMKTWVSAALTDEMTCLDGLAQFASSPAVRAGIRKKVVELSRLTSNALALVNQLDRD
ncbi:21 kDa protein-like [Canna indica]|uniref:21 kDa protein-like n=1 Tax=Canna indica TaxID=4628 RepID=A0AAQ3KE43_9LILI|nr:21 kDa protein-like [Canna indica]